MALARVYHYYLHGVGGGCDRTSLTKGNHESPQKRGKSPHAKLTLPYCFHQHAAGWNYQANLRVLLLVEDAAGVVHDIADEVDIETECGDRCLLTAQVHPVGERHFRLHAGWRGAGSGAVGYRTCDRHFAVPPLRRGPRNIPHTRAGNGATIRRGGRGGCAGAARHLLGVLERAADPQLHCQEVCGVERLPT
jgi:hypothetical protein